MMKDIPGYEGKYAATDDGRIYTYHRKKYLSPVLDKYGYYAVKLCNNGKAKSYLVHRLILMTFNPCDNYENLQVNHKDENKINNNLNNLEWMNCYENIHYGTGIKRRAETQKIKVKCVETGQIFNSMADATKYYGYNSCSNLSCCLSGRQKTFAGYHWEKVIDNEN